MVGLDLSGVVEGSGSGGSLLPTEISRRSLSDLNPNAIGRRIPEMATTSYSSSTIPDICNVCTTSPERRSMTWIAQMGSAPFSAMVAPAVRHVRFAHGGDVFGRAVFHGQADQEQLAGTCGRFLKLRTTVPDWPDPTNRPGMSRIFIAWELGGGMGHIQRLYPVAKELRARGHEVVFAVRDLYRSEPLLGAEGFPLFQAPMPRVQGGGGLAASFAQILLRCGYGDAAVLTGLVRAWRELLTLTAPDLVLLDYSPTAMLAARSMGLARARIGDGFDAPPATRPMPSLQPWKPTDPAELLAIEDEVLASVNGMLRSFATEPVGTLADMFDGDAHFLCTFPELDHFPGRGDVKYWGPVLSADGGKPVTWPDGDEDARIFVYVSARHAEFEPMIRGLGTLGTPFCAYVRDLEPSRIENLETGTLRITREPVDMTQVGRECRLTICHGGHGTMASMLLAGKPVYVAPHHLEQALLGYRVAETGAALVSNPAKRGHDYAAHITKMLNTPSFFDAAEAIAAAHPGFTETGNVRAIADAAEAILA
jgi:UDP:flavonoid glycosyltransferase YjiC (YdhE family)